MNLAGEIVIVTGSPGVGKTTASDALASTCAAPAVHLRADEFWDRIKSGFVPPTLPASQHQNEVVIDAIASAASAYARGGYFVVVDGIIGPWFLARFRSAAAGVQLHYVVLTANLDVAIARAQRRPEHQADHVDTIRMLHPEFSCLGELQKHTLDTTSLSPSETVERLRSGVLSGAFRLSNMPVITATRPADDGC